MVIESCLIPLILWLRVVVIVQVLPAFEIEETSNPSPKSLRYWIIDSFVVLNLGLLTSTFPIVFLEAIDIVDSTSDARLSTSNSGYRLSKFWDNL